MPDEKEHTDAEYDKEQRKRIIELNNELDKALRAADRAVAVAEKLEARIKELQAELDRLRKEVPPKDWKPRCFDGDWCDDCLVLNCPFKERVP